VTYAEKLAAIRERVRAISMLGAHSCMADYEGQCACHDRLEEILSYFERRVDELERTIQSWTSRHGKTPWEAEIDSLAAALGLEEGEDGSVSGALDSGVCLGEHRRAGRVGAQDRCCSGPEVTWSDVVGGLLGIALGIPLAIQARRLNRWLQGKADRLLDRLFGYEGKR
jgi:hypothetical protein